MSKELSPSVSLFSRVSELIYGARGRVVSSVNSELVRLYWNIGKVIREEILRDERAEYGAKTIETLAKELVAEYGNSYSKRNLQYMVRFYDVFPDEEIVNAASSQLSWTHFRSLFSIDEPLKRDFYMTLCINERWSVRELNGRIGTMLYERTALSKKPENAIAGDLQKLREERRMSADIALRDPYVLDFLGLKDTYSEKDLENAILSELERFILEMGRDFTFVGRQVRITVGNEDYYIDLLFFHRKLRRLVLVELKLDKFQPGHKGQVELYLRWLEKNEMNEGEQPPIAIILCADKEEEMVELLELDKSGIHVAQYLTQLPPKEVLEHKLRKAITKARLTLEQHEIGEGGEQDEKNG